MANILVKDYNAQICDIDFVKKEDAKCVVGTPEFAAPEVCFLELTFYLLNCIMFTHVLPAPDVFYYFWIIFFFFIIFLASLKNI